MEPNVKDDTVIVIPNALPDHLNLGKEIEVLGLNPPENGAEITIKTLRDAMSKLPIKVSELESLRTVWLYSVFSSTMIPILMKEIT